jgi:hypothetical protein
MAKKSVTERVFAEYPGFASEAESMSESELRARLSNMAIELAETEKAQEDDAWLESAKTQVAELSAPYRETKKAIQLKSRYVALVLEQRGKGITTTGGVP